MGLDLLGCKDDAFVQSAEYSLEQPFCYINISFDYPSTSNQEGSARLINMFMQSN